MLRVYYCRLNLDDPDPSGMILSAYRTEKLAVQKAALVRKQSLYSELLLRFALKDSGFAPEASLEITAGEHGKPRLAGGEVCFNLSHSSEVLLCALSDREIGADIQKTTRAKDALMKRFFTEDERTFVLSSKEADEAFTEIWTKKESWCKLSGEGLALPLRSFSVLDDAIAPLLLHRRAGEYHAAVCGQAVLDGIIEWIDVETGMLL